MSKRFNISMHLSNQIRLNYHLRLHRHWPYMDDVEKFRFLTSALAGEAGELAELCIFGLLTASKAASLANTMKKEWRGDFQDPMEMQSWREKFADEMNDVGNYLFMTSQLAKHNILEGMLKKLIEVEERPQYKRAVLELASKLSGNPEYVAEDLLEEKRLANAMAYLNGLD